MTFNLHRHHILPGFAPSLGLTLLYLSLLVLIPLAGLVLKTTELTWAEFVATVTTPRAVATYKLTLGTAFAAALVNVFFGMTVAWTLVRYRFPGQRLIDGLVDLPFAMPTAVAGIALTSIYSVNGWVGQYAGLLGLTIAFTPIGIFVALTFIGLPFVVRTVQPVLQDIEVELEEASASLGAGRWQTFRRVILPVVLPAVLTGFTLAFARALGEYGSVVFIAGNQPMRTEITTLLIMTKLEQFDYVGATAIATVMLGASLVLLLLINALHGWARRSAEAI
jgi:sulfate/thiosulfate transport system permease protein